MLKLQSIISQCIQLFWNEIEYKNADRREKQRDKEVEAKEETVNKSVSIQLTTY